MPQLIAEKVDNSIMIIDTFSSNIVRFDANKIPFRVLKVNFDWTRKQIIEAIKNI